MSKIDTSAEAVERLARCNDALSQVGGSAAAQTAATLRALVAERDAAKVAAANNWQHYLDFKKAADRYEADRDRLAARVAELEAHIANIHNRVRHEFSAEVERAADKAFTAMSGRAALAGSKTDDR